jgi:hypothetical protein
MSDHEPFSGGQQVYISGEEMTAYCMQLIRENWINPYVDTSSWQFFDLSCHARDASGDQVCSFALCEL